ncbi:MAG: hypothetical protein ACOZHQ_04760 [Thermodesulfobacteriota bacterium]
MSEDPILSLYAQRVGYDAADLARLGPADPRRRHIARLAEAGQRLSIVAQVIEANHCNAGYRPGDRFVLDADGNFIAKLCPKRICVYLASQMVVPVALINERLSEGLEPNAFHFMRQAACPDRGVACAGYGRVVVKIGAEPRQEAAKP